MEIKKLNYKKESDSQRRLWKIAVLKIWWVFFKQSESTTVKIVRKISEAYLRLCRTAIAELFCENSKPFKDINYFWKKKFIIGVWQGLKYASEGNFFQNR